MRASFAGEAKASSRPFDFHVIHSSLFIRCSSVALLHAFLLWPVLACIDALQVVSVFL